MRFFNSGSRKDPKILKEISKAEKIQRQASVMHSEKSSLTVCVNISINPICFKLVISLQIQGVPNAQFFFQYYGNN